MKTTGIVRKIDPLGRVVLPRELRKTLNIGPEDSIEIYTDEDMVILRKYVPGCMCCPRLDNLTTFNGVTLCPDCIAKFGKAVR